MIILQENSNVWVTKIFRVQFQYKEQGLQVYNGCFMGRMKLLLIGRKDLEESYMKVLNITLKKLNSDIALMIVIGSYSRAISLMLVMQKMIK
jgi:hypothetical protein